MKLKLKDIEENKCKYYTGTIKHSCEKYLINGANGHCIFIREDKCKFKKLIHLKNVLNKTKEFLNEIYENIENEVYIGQSYNLILQIEKILESEVQ